MKFVIIQTFFNNKKKFKKCNQFKSGLIQFAVNKQIMIINNLAKYNFISFQSKYNGLKLIKITLLISIRHIHQ